MIREIKPLLLILTLLITSSVVVAQSTTSKVEIVKVYSQNEHFYLRTIPYDNVIPSLRGVTSVYATGKSSPMYTLDRAFDLLAAHDTLILSNDGEVIFYVITYDPDEAKDGLKSVNVYKRGKLIRSFTETEITGCDKTKERCSLVYANDAEVVDDEKSRWGPHGYQKVFKAGVDEKQRFLSDFAIFSFDNFVYITDSKQRVHTFDLRDGSLIESDSFDNMFERLRTKGRFTRSEEVSYDSPVFLDFPNLRDGRDASISLANFIGMKTGDPNKAPDDPYKWYSFSVDCNLFRDGSVEIESIDIDPELPKDKILEFFKINRFDTRAIPKVFPRWYLDSNYFYLRKKNDLIARQEGEQQRIERQQEAEKRLTLESVNGVYIPANLGECFPELDKRLLEVDKKEMRALPKRDDMIVYHHSLGRWMRNNWVLWGGSRLSKYFNDRGISHPEEMSSIILYHYHDWLNGKQDTWKEWEKRAP